MLISSTRSLEIAETSNVTADPLSTEVEPLEEGWLAVGGISCRAAASETSLEGARSPAFPEIFALIVVEPRAVMSISVVSKKALYVWDPPTEKSPIEKVDI